VKSAGDANLKGLCKFKAYIMCLPKALAGLVILFLRPLQSGLLLMTESGSSCYMEKLCSTPFYVFEVICLHLRGFWKADF